MDLLKFNDYCTITRNSGCYDEYDNPINADILYEGACMFQAGGQTSLSIVTRNDVVYIPSNDVIIEANDVINVTTSRGRKTQGVINKVRDIEMPLTHELLTKIEIKQNTQRE